jgi:hypothetical protein
MIRICERQGVPVLADRAYTGVGTHVTTGLKRPPGGELTRTQRTINRALAQARAPSRARYGTAEVLADLPQITHQPKPHDRHRQSRPHPGEATLKTLIEGTSGRP